MVEPSLLCIGLSGRFGGPLESEVLDRIRSCSNKGRALGSAEFCNLIEGRTQRRAAPLSAGWKKGRKRGYRAS